MHDVGIPILTVLGLGYAEGNSRQEKWDRVEFLYCHRISVTRMKRLEDWQRKQPE